jgi:hypothetical protein
VVLIERSSGVQVGRDSDQHSVYRVHLPSVSLTSSESLARQLLGERSPWSNQVFAHDAQASFGQLAGGPDSFRSLTHAPRGDTLVIVRNSRGVQIGDHNTQRNDFRIRVVDVHVHAGQIGMTQARKNAIAQLQRNPADQGAARSLADEVGKAARSDLVVDLTAQVSRDVGHPAAGRPAIVSGQAGAQRGERNRASVKVRVTVSKVDTSRLRVDLERVARAARAAPEVSRPVRPSGRTLSRPPYPEGHRDPGRISPARGRDIGPAGGRGGGGMGR